MPGTTSAAAEVHRLAGRPQVRCEAADVLRALAAVDRAVAAGDPAGVPAELLREVVISTARLVGRAWLKADSDSSADFTALYATRLPPPLPDLDRILASVLSGRFGGLAAGAASTASRAWCLARDQPGTKVLPTWAAVLMTGPGRRRDADSDSRTPEVNRS